MRYANGIVMTEQPFDESQPNWQGIKFIGDKGWLKVARGYLAYSTKGAYGSLDKKYQPGTFMNEVLHMQNFLDAITKHDVLRAPVEYGTSTNTLCCIFNIARELKRPVHWNPSTLSFEGDREAVAHRLYWYEYRRPYTLPYCDHRG